MTIDINRVRLRNKINLQVKTAYIPCQTHGLQERSQVEVRGGRTPDFSGETYRLIRNKKWIY